MIGQVGNKLMIEKWYEAKSFPRFMIVTGPNGCGKSTMTTYLANRIGGYVIAPGIKVDDVRQAIQNSYKCATETIYIFLNADKMSVQAKNALLKVTEEPPRRAHFIMTVEDIGNTLPTLRSRGTEIAMEPYSKGDLLHFTEDVNILDIANTPGQVKQLQEMNVLEFINFCEKVIDNIGKVSGVNAFKIGNSFKFKETDTEGYDVSLFFNCLTYLYREKAVTQMMNTKAVDTRYLDSIRCCIKYYKEFNTTGLKKDSTFDMWILELREIWRS